MLDPAAPAPQFLLPGQPRNRPMNYTLADSTQYLPRIFILMLTGVLFVSCGSAPQIAPTETVAVETQSTTAQIDELIERAESSTGNAAVLLRLEAAEALLGEGLLLRADNQLAQIPRSNLLPTDLRFRYVLAQASLSRQRGNNEAAIRWLTGALAEDADDNDVFGTQLIELLGNIQAEEGRFADAVLTYSRATPYLQNDNSTNVFNAIWDALQRIDSDDLARLASAAESYELRGWIELERVYREDEQSIRAQLDAIAQWRRIWSSHSASRRLPDPLAELESVWAERPRQIALILPIQQPAGLTIQEGFFSAYYEALTISREVPQVSVFDSSGVSDIAEIYDQAVASGVDLVIGPLNKQLVNQLAAREQLPVPTLALNYADSPSRATENLYQFGLAPEDDIEQLSNLAWQAGYRNAAIVTPQSSDYVRLRELFANKWESRGGAVVSETTFAETTDYSDTVKRLIAIDSSEARAERLLQLLPRNNMEFIPRRRQDIDFIFLVANPSQGRSIKPTLAFYFAQDIPVYSLPSIFDGSNASGDNRDLDGIWFTDTPWLLESNDNLKATVNQSLRPANGPSQRLRALGIDSFRLYARLEQFASGKLNRLPGTTGVLSMTDDQRVHRSVSVARFINGRPQLQSELVVSSSD